MSLDDRANEIMATELAARFPYIWFDRIAEYVPADYLIKGLIDRQSCGVVYGPAGSGKTFFGIDMAAHIATGMQWRDKRVRQGLVVYVAAEAGASILRRFTAWRDRHLGESFEDRVPLGIITKGINLLDQEAVAELLGELEQIAEEAGLPLALVVFDTLSRSIPGGDENSPRDMTSAIHAADMIRDRLGAATLFVHHSGKDSTKGARGHSALFAAADTVIAINDHIATVEKSRDGETGADFGFKLDVVGMGQDTDGDPITTCVIVPTDAAPKKQRKKTLPGAAQVALKALHEAIADHGQRMPETGTIPAGVHAVDLDTWRNRFRLRYGTDDRGNRAVRQAFQRGREILLRDQLVALSDPWVWVV
ncbi:MAG: hypothetical protein BMS9Abin36_0793 [Gammaproteobacteria bacterium]|nr:MAG: hypothetical protein BMS9Abin36_0793 [Gammaproteobacteria bacterium]